MTDFVGDCITIWYARKHTLEQLPVYEVRVQAQLANRQVIWSMTMLPGQKVPIQLLDISQQVVLIADEKELMIDSTGLKREFPIQLLEEVSDRSE